MITYSVSQVYTPNNDHSMLPHAVIFFSIFSRRVRPVVRRGLQSLCAVDGDALITIDRYRTAAVHTPVIDLPLANRYRLRTVLTDPIAETSKGNGRQRVLAAFSMLRTRRLGRVPTSVIVTAAADRFDNIIIGRPSTRR